jgi:hypothetical protein
MVGCACVLAPLAMAAGPGAPTTYSLDKPARSASDMSIAIHRDGARETIKLSRANGWHSQMWFDFATHKQYAVDSNAPGQCSVIDYTSDGPPGLLDPVAGASDGDEMVTEIQAHATGTSKDTLGGIATRVISAPGAKVWIDDAHHFVMKAEVVMDGSTQPQTLFDFTGISFAKPDPALLTPPAHCKHINGSSNANGGHAEVPIH